MVHIKSVPIPSFVGSPWSQFPPATFEAAPAPGVLPEGFFSTVNAPTFFKLGNYHWVLPEAPRMDAVAILDRGQVVIKERRFVRGGELVAMHQVEDGSQGIKVFGNELFDAERSASETAAMPFMTAGVSRERPVDYSILAELLMENKLYGGKAMWVVGPAVVHAGAHRDFCTIIDRGLVDILSIGNATAVHDIESALYGTALGAGEAEGDHSSHMRAINEVHKAGSVSALVDSGRLTGGIMHACITRTIPTIIAGSIRDDGPLPETITSVLESQEAIRTAAQRTTLVVILATVLHGIATGNIFPTYYVRDDRIFSLPFITVDMDEFAVTKLKDRGTGQAIGVVGNARDFLAILAGKFEK
ncbi:hypothetical protein A3A71_01110 [Candidatus Berkelbacteria bacterium RIFCSPLOWO2_01_FULL_50_28]|uniref:Arginine dihydrolase ArgZ/ArgE-like C-terminal second subdomain domain-containing protein n=1 Tax=Candidatus Berkelbacteria bacterium RIFCSPLOWO2_01_FULL_50_28 TaxID=1797471 RepID=A0A1F5EB48_9BACT|nr:MAG: hypothetical protein A2807_01680 [Candidatus Berkelbacteria bacterium RIFCSPHIGHO2_01_FULL_50_36]OGD64637.1 MAG: hypothetical protein A3A71_01110 [Candidatus Berkelbacteria bacterium RIFCSPLOWO2_01_FULL_50_28]